MPLVVGTISLPDQTKGPNPQTINMSFLKPKWRLQQHSMPPSLQPALPPSLLHSLFQHIPLSTSFLPHPLNFNTCLSCFFSFFSFYLPPLLPDPCCVSSNYQSTEEKPFHLKDWQLSLWNTIKWLPLKRKGKLELRYAAVCRTA